MLLGKHRGRNQNCRLLAVQDALHHRPQRNFGFAEADVAAQQPLHGSRRLHVVLDLRNCAQLIVGFRVFEALFKLLLPWRVRREGKARAALSLGIELNQPCSQILCRCLRLCLCLLPLIAPELVEPHGLVFAAGADVLADRVQLCRGNI